MTVVYCVQETEGDRGVKLFSPKREKTVERNSLTEHHQLARCLSETVFVLQLYLDLSCIFSVAPAQQQAALAATSLQLCVAVIMELLPLLIPLHLDGLVANKLHFEDGIVTHFHCQRLSKRVEVFGVNPRGIWWREAWVIQGSNISFQVVLCH